VRDKAVPAKADGGAAALHMRPKKPRLTEIQKLQSAAEDQRKLRSESRTAAQSGKEKQVRASEESGKAVQEKLTAVKPTKEKPTKEKAQGSKGQKGTENKVVEGGKKLKKGSGSNVKVRKCLCPSDSLGGGWFCCCYNNVSAVSSAVPQKSLFLCLQIQKAKGDVDMAAYAEGHSVEVMGYGVEEEEKVVAHGIVKNVEGGSLHGVSIEEGCVSLQVTKSIEPSYMLFKGIDLDDPPLSIMGEAVGNFILWPTEFLRHLPVAE
jgi:hypothetical protein